MEENSHFDRKSLKMVEGKTADWNELSKDCVCFANGYGGEIHIGIEDEEELPNATQKIKPALLDKISKTIPQLTLNVGVVTSIETAENGGEYINLKVLRSSQTIACTSKCSRISAAKRVAVMECPPSSKKLSVMPTCLISSSCCQISQSALSVSLVGAT